MFKGHVTFKHSITGVRLLKLNPLAVPSPEYPDVSQVLVKTPDERTLLVEVHFDSVTTQQEAKDIGNPIAESIANRMAYGMQTQVGETVFDGSAFEAIDSGGEEDVEQRLNITQTATCFVAGHVVVEPSPDEIADLQALLVEPDNSKDVWRSRFRWIMQHSDPVAKFLHFYSVLLALVGGKDEKQAKVDAFIKSCEKTVAITTATYNGKTVNETVYSRLRNEIGHVRKATPQATREEMERHVDKLAQHVRTAIECHA